MYTITLQLAVVDDHGKLASSDRQTRARGRIGSITGGGGKRPTDGLSPHQSRVPRRFLKKKGPSFLDLSSIHSYTPNLV